jgi:glycerol-3-phosphate O-acyltransferase
VEALALHLMAEIERAVPILPVPLVAAALLQAPAPTSPEALRTRAAALLEGLTARGSVLRLSPLRLEATISEGLTPLLQRGLVGADLAQCPQNAAILQFYAAAIAQRLSGPA